MSDDDDYPIEPEELERAKPDPQPASPLKPCPFCGGEAVVEQEGNRSRSHIIACEYCGCRLETGEEWDKGSAWNRRANPINADLLATLRRLLDTECESCREDGCDSYSCDCPCHDDADMARRIARDVIVKAEKEAKS